MQMSLFEPNAAEKIHETFIKDLKNGSGFENGKERIAKFFKQKLSKSETIKLLKDEYGNGGKSTIASGGYRQQHDSNGIKIMLATREEKQYTWSQVYDVLLSLIEEGKYIKALESESQ